MPATFTLTPSDFALLCDVIQTVARSSRLPRDEAEDFCQHVHLRLLERNYAPIAGFRGKSSLRTFLTVVVSRQLLDWRNSRYGKWRPSARARRLGPAAVDLDRLISRDGHPVEEAIAILQARRPSMNAAAVRELASQLPRRSKIRTFVPDNLEGLATGTFEDPVETAEAAAEQRQTMGMLRRAFGRLSDEDRRLLSLRFEQRMPIPAIASFLGEPAKPLYRRISKLVSALRRSLAAMNDAGADMKSASRQGSPALFPSKALHRMSG
jgi:RNA polymerase sigma factor (sigma-70 family)